MSKQPHQSSESPVSTLAERPGGLDRFVELLTQHQSRLYAFIYTLMPDPERAGDVFQETNMVLWRKAEEFDHDREFLPWALTIARFQVRAARQRLGRDRHVFDERAFDVVADELARRAGRLPARQSALIDCLQHLPDDQRQLVRRRYEEGDALERIAAALGQTANAVGVALYRVRQALAECVERRVAREEAR
jgi:RNA polymerase sigma-70 factor (ECF subfamily)